MTALTGHFGKVDFIDCRNVHHTQVYDLTFWDPPFNVNYGVGKVGYKGGSYSFSNDKIGYEDKLSPNDYVKLLREVLWGLCKVSKFIIVHPGHVNQYLWWTQISPPNFELTRYVCNGKTGGQNCYLRHREPLLCYGQSKIKWNLDVFKSTALWGFLRPKNEPLLCHKCPMPIDFLLAIFKQYQPTSVYDPMCGRGAVPEACEALGISYYATELKEEYRSDIQYRIKKGQSMYKQLHAKQITAWCK